MLNSLHKVLSSIKNGQKNNLLVVTCKESKIAIQVLNVLQENGFILGYRYKSGKPLYQGNETIVPRKINITKGGCNVSYRNSELENVIEILLKYNKEKPVIKSCKLISKPSNKVYKTIQELQSMQEMQRTHKDNPKVNPNKSGLIRNVTINSGEKNWKSLINGMYILTTTRGIISDKTALKYNISGQIICKIN
jgi:ribosomal protein S8